MFRKSPWLDDFPVLSLTFSRPSNYQLRERETAGQHCTAEVASELLTQASDLAAADALQDYFAQFRERYMALKNHHIQHK